MRSAASAALRTPAYGPKISWFEPVTIWQVFLEASLAQKIPVDYLAVPKRNLFFETSVPMIHRDGGVRNSSF